MKMTTQPEKSGSRLLLRALNTTANIIIAMAILVQGVGLGMNLSGGAETHSPRMLSVLGYSGLVLLLAIVLALAKSLLNLTRSFRNAQARVGAAIYLGVTLWMFFAPALFSPSSFSTSSNPVLREEQENEQFLAGRDWAMDKQPTRGSQCPGSQEFIRGCRSYINQRGQSQFQAGRDWAENNRPGKASECKGPLTFVRGCHAFFLEHLAKPRPDGQGKYEGMSTAECQTEINAIFGTRVGLEREKGNDQAANSISRRHWQPELKDCENYDQHNENIFMPRAYSRLQQILAKMKAGSTIGEEEKSIVLNDFSEMSIIGDQPYRTAYMNMAEEYFARLEGRYMEPVKIYPNLTCEEYMAKIDAMKKLDEERVASMRALQRSDGVVTDGPRHNELNQQRIDMIWELKQYTDGAKAAGCENKRN